MRQVALQISTKTHVTVSSHLELVGRAFLRNFITTTLTCRLGTWLAFRFARPQYEPFDRLRVNG
jgi:hypothetical protein